MEKVLMVLSFFLGFLSVVMAFVLSWNTNKLVRTEDERAKSLIAETQKMIVEMQNQHRETIRYLQQSLDYLGSLIKVDGERTRELINKVLKQIGS
jgi:DNA-directed RNA polymerase subunit F